MFHPIYTCQHIDHDIKVTGKLDDPAWKMAEVAEMSDIVTGEPIPHRATARLLYNDEYLYVGFSCEDDYIHAMLTGDDEPIWREGCFEFFVSPSGNVRYYYEINVSPLNTLFDTFIINSTEKVDKPKRRMNSFISYTCRNMITKTWVNGEMEKPGAAQGWSAEYAIPFVSIAGADNLVPVAGDEWRANMCHIASAERRKEMVHACWATIGLFDFHIPWFFGTVRFA
ncbi:MAG TPA: carbohydrate-binding family 9-like protein [Armatimonadota bacterium]|nr:carbohydrate-binding family 9-like protein [Armatimonadota bacterium]